MSVFGGGKLFAALELLFAEVPDEVELALSSVGRSKSNSTMKCHISNFQAVEALGHNLPISPLFTPPFDIEPLDDVVAGMTSCCCGCIVCSLSIVVEGRCGRISANSFQKSFLACYWTLNNPLVPNLTFEDRGNGQERLGMKVLTYGFPVARAWRVCYWGLAARCSRCIKETTALPASCHLSLASPCTHTVRML